MVKIGQFFFESGTPISCTIKGITIDNAIVHFFDETKSVVRGWVCHNNSDFDGDESPNRYNFRYSWCFHVSKDGGLTDEVDGLKPLLTGVSLKKDVKIVPELLFFIKEFSEQNKCDYAPLFIYKFDLFDEFNQYEIDDLEGFITLKNERKTVQVKISRFIRQVGIKFNDLVSSQKTLIKVDISDKLIEILFNKFVAFQKQNQNLEFYSSEEILKGYKKENYFGTSGVIHNSCMSDKLEYLNLYTQNPNQVQLAVIYIQQKIAARTIVWTATDGKKYHDRIYYTNDWLENLMKNKLNKLGIQTIKESGFKMVQLDKWNFKNYPYIDNFYHFDSTNGTLLYYPENIKTLRSAHG
jgi:hypothetical protein